MSSNREKALKIFNQLSSAIDAGDKELAGQRFSELCDVLGWGASQFSDKLNISDQSYYRWRSGEIMPRKGSLKKIEQFLKSGDLEWQGARLNPLDLGIQTWRHMAARAERMDVTEVWIFSAEELLEGKSPEARNKMTDVIRAKNKKFFYVFPPNSSAASTWRRWVDPLRPEKRSPESGQVIGFSVTNTWIDRFPMFIHGVYVVLYRSNKDPEGFLAFRAKPEALRLLIPSDLENGEKPLGDLIWIEVEEELADSWYYTYCTQLKRILNQSASDDLVIERDFTANN